jgi:hypothetical protein
VLHRFDEENADMIRQHLDTDPRQRAFSGAAAVTGVAYWTTKRHNRAPGGHSS